MTASPEPRLVSGGRGADGGHLEELRRDPIGLMRRVRARHVVLGEARVEL